MHDTNTSGAARALAHLPLAALFCASLAACTGEESRAAGSSPSAPEAAAESVSPLGDLDLDHLIDLQEELLEDASDALSAVRDADAVAAARTRLEEVAGRARDVAARRLELAAGTAKEKLELAKASLALNEPLQELRAQLERLEDVPGAAEQLEPALERLLSAFGTEER